jgi:ABC-type glycerol-3-phosphate transport system substrate-binding protein
VYVLAGLYVDLNPLVKSRNYDLGQYLPSAVTAVQNASRNGKLYGMPNAVHPSWPAVLINKTMFDKGGVPVPKEDWTTGPHPGWKDWTFDAMQNAAIALTKRTGARVTQWGLQMQGASNPFYVLVDAMRSEGGDYVDQAGTKLQFESPEALKVIGFYGDLYTKYNVTPLVADMPSGGPDLMASGRVAMRNAAIWDIGSAQQLFKDFEWKMLPAPRGMAGVDGEVQVNTFSINTVSKHPDIAFDVLAHVCEAKWMWNSVAMGGLAGGQKEFWDSPKLTADPAYAIFATLMKTVSPAVLTANGRINQLVDTFIAETDPLWIGQQVDARQLVKQISPKLQAIVDSAPATPKELAK